MARKVMILAGAPEASSLKWDETELLNHFDTSFAKFTDTSVPGPHVISSYADAALWRSIPLVPTHLKTGFSQSHELYAGYEGDNGFFTTVSPSLPWASRHSDDDQGSAEITLSQFYDHSIAIHHDIPSSQLPPAASSSSSTHHHHLSSLTSSAADPSSLTNSSSGLDYSTNTSAAAADEEPSLLRAQRLAKLGTAHHLSDLEDLPNAKYLQAIQPQTMSVNLIAAIISVAEPRTVKTRWGANKSLVELLVGDDTRAGFSVTFWLQHDSNNSVSNNNNNNNPTNTTEDVLRNLRRQDVVLLRNVALGVFMNKVHGHSLRKDLTKIDLLYRKKLFVGDRGGLYSTRDIHHKHNDSSSSSSKGGGGGGGGGGSSHQVHPQLLKARQVREWAINFVGVGPPPANKHLGNRGGGGDGGGGGGKRSVRSWELPPEDTQ